jgi:hypothetical protein
VVFMPILQFGAILSRSIRSLPWSSLSKTSILLTNWTIRLQSSSYDRTRILRLLTMKTLPQLTEYLTKWLTPGTRRLN